MSLRISSQTVCETVFRSSYVIANRSADRCGNPFSFWYYLR